MGSTPTPAIVDLCRPTFLFENIKLLFDRVPDFSISFNQNVNCSTNATWVMKGVTLDETPEPEISPIVVLAILTTTSFFATVVDDCFSSYFQLDRERERRVFIILLIVTLKMSTCCLLSRLAPCPLTISQIREIMKSTYLTVVKNQLSKKKCVHLLIFAERRPI